MIAPPVSQLKAARPVLRNRALLALCSVVFVAFCGQGMLTTVRVLYVHSRGGSLSIISAMTAAYLLANLVCQYPWGWLADRWGRKPVMLAGLSAQGLLTIGYILVSDPLLFVVLRLFEGVAAASILPTARATVSDLVPREQRGRAYGLFTAFFNLGFLFGPAAGGLIASAGYRWVFGTAVALRLVAVLLLGIAFAGRTTRWALPAREELRPRLGGLFTLPLVAGYTIAFGDYMWLGFDMTLAPLWMREHLGASLAQIGLTYSIWAVPSAIISPFGGRFADRYSRPALILGFGLAQVPIYAAYAGARSIYFVMLMFGVHACLYSVVSPAVDAHVAIAAPALLRARVQATYTAIGMGGALAGAAAFVPLYALDYRLPLLSLGVCYGACIVSGGTLILLHQRRSTARPEESAPDPESALPPAPSGEPMSADLQNRDTPPLVP